MIEEEFSNEIKLLSSRDAIRSRPQFYVGPLSDALLANTLLREAFCCARDEARNGNLSQTLVVQIFAEGSEWSQSFVADVPAAPMTRTGRSDQGGTQISFQLDRAIIGEIEFDFDELVEWGRNSGDGITWIIAERATDRVATVYSARS